MLDHAPFPRIRTFKVYSFGATLVWTVVLVLAAAGAIEARLWFLLVTFAAWAAGFALAALARERLPHPRARTTPWWPWAPHPPRSTPYDFRLHRGSFALYALVALLAGAVVLALSVLLGGLSGGFWVGAFCVSFGWLIAWVQVTIVREASPHPNPRPAPWLKRGSV
jgi:hypothetical protein